MIFLFNPPTIFKAFSKHENVDLFDPAQVNVKKDLVVCPIHWNLWSIEAVLQGNYQQALKNIDFEHVCHPIISPRIKHLIKEYNTKILLYNDFECRDLIRSTDNLREFARHLGVDFHKIFFSTSEYLGHMKLQTGNVLSFDWGFAREQVYFDTANILQHPKSKTYRIVSLNYRSTQERFAYCLYMHLKHRERFLYSYLQEVLEDISDYRPLFPDIFTTSNQEAFYQTIPKLLDGSCPDQHQVISIRRFLEQASINVVFETNWEGPSSRAQQVSEKTYKSIKIGRPFLLFTTKGGFLRHLKKLGFKTFSPFINEAYDDPRLSYAERYKLLLEESDRLCSLTDLQMADMEEKLQSTVQHNLHILANGAVPNIFELMNPSYRINSWLKSIIDRLSQN